jgi:hypothetical protein
MKYVYFFIKNTEETMSFVHVIRAWQLNSQNGQFNSTQLNSCVKVN